MPSRVHRPGPIPAVMSPAFTRKPSKLESPSALPMLRFLLNVLWFVLGGFVMGVGWWLAGLLAVVSIVGIS